MLGMTVYLGTAGNEQVDIRDRDLDPDLLVGAAFAIFQLIQVKRINIVDRRPQQRTQVSPAFLPGP